jgi:hypothetical protein
MTDKPIFTISDVLPTDRLPRPLSEFDWDMWEQDKDDFDTNKKYKWLEFVYQETFKNKILWNNLDNYNLWSIKKSIENEKKYNWIEKNINNKNIINRNTWSTTENWIYSYEDNFITNSNNEFRLFIKIFDLEKFGKYEIIKLLKNIFELTWFWKKKSTWKWLFNIENINENFKESFYWDKNIEDLKNYILLSNFIPSENDSTNWNYKIFTKFPKMWEENSIAWQNFYKKPLIMLEAWATFEKDENYKWYVWKIIKDVDFQNKWISHYAYWFTLEF